MDDDDPERRIAELESRLGDQVSDHVALTPQDVHDLAFASARGGRRGYHEHEVDAFLDRIEATLRDPTATGSLTAADLRAVAFSKPPLGRRGYDEDEVDAFISRVEAQLARRPGRPSPVDTAAPSGRHSKRSKQSAAETIANHVFAFGAELFAHHPVVTWRAPLALGLLMILLGFISHPAFFVVAGFLLLWAAIEWRSR